MKESKMEADASQNEKNELKQQQEIVHENLKAIYRSNLAAGGGLRTIKKKRLYRYYVPGEKTSWEQYCEKEFGITPQYANRLIKAYKCYEHVKEYFKAKGRSEEFNLLPENADLYEQLSKFKEDEQGPVLESLIDEYKELGETPDKIRASDIRNLLANSEDESEDNKVEELASDTFMAISSNKSLLDKIANLKSTEMKRFAKALQERISEADKGVEHDK